MFRLTLLALAGLFAAAACAEPWAVVVTWSRSGKHRREAAAAAAARGAELPPRDVSWVNEHIPLEIPVYLMAKGVKCTEAPSWPGRRTTCLQYPNYSGREAHSVVAFAVHRMTDRGHLPDRTLFLQDDAWLDDPARIRQLDFGCPNRRASTCHMHKLINETMHPKYGYRRGIECAGRVFGAGRIPDGPFVWPGGGEFVLPRAAGERAWHSGALLRLLPIVQGKFETPHERQPGDLHQCVEPGCCAMSLGWAHTLERGWHHLFGLSFTDCFNVGRTANAIEGAGGWPGGDVCALPSARAESPSRS